MPHKTSSDMTQWRGRVISLADDTWNYRDEHFIKLLIEQNPDGICSIDSTGLLIRTNPALCTLTGRTQQELIGTHCFSFIAPENLRHVWKAIEDVMDGQKTTTVSTLVRHKSGSKFKATVSISPLCSQSGVIGCYLVMKDCSKEQDTEELLQTTQKILVYAQQIAHLGSWELNPRTQIAICSEEIFRIFGLPYTGYLPIIKILDHIHPDDREQMEQQMIDLLHGQPYDVECRIVRPSGEIRHIHARRQTMSEGKHKRIVGTIQDMTDNKRVQEALMQSEKLALVGQLAAGIAHEIRNPLTSLKGFLNFMAEGHFEDHYMDIMQSELTRIEAVTSELLVLARPHPVQFQTIDLYEHLSKVVELLQPQSMMRDVSVVLQECDQQVHVECDPSQLQQVLINVVKNAIEASESGYQVRLSIDTSLPEHVSVRIADTGQGIPAEHLNKLGTPFFTTKDKGTGLGLMVSKKIIQSHGGDLTVASELNKGTVVTVTLPRRQHSPGPRSVE